MIARKSPALERATRRVAMTTAAMRFSKSVAEKLQGVRCCGRPAMVFARAVRASARSTVVRHSVLVVRNSQWFRPNVHLHFPLRFQTILHSRTTSAWRNSVIAFKRDSTAPARAHAGRQLESERRSQENLSAPVIERIQSAHDLSTHSVARPVRGSAQPRLKTFVTPFGLPRHRSQVDFRVSRKGLSTAESSTTRTPFRLGERLQETFLTRRVLSTSELRSETQRGWQSAMEARIAPVKLDVPRKRSVSTPELALVKQPVSPAHVSETIESPAEVIARTTMPISVPPPLDIVDLGNRVYEQIERKIRIERERRGL